MKRKDLRRRIAELLPAMNLDELSVVTRICERINMGRKQYRPLAIQKDTRNWQLEMLFELLDGCVYGSCAISRALRRKSKVAKAP